MQVPGSNLLKMAATLITFQTGARKRFLMNITDQQGGVVAQYGPPETIQASDQPVPRSMFEQLGLDFQRDYRMIYASVKLYDLRRDKTPDQVVYNGRMYTVESNTDWQNADGWQGSICVDIGPGVI